jgi:hypothetical protein
VESLIKLLPSMPSLRSLWFYIKDSKQPLPTSRVLEARLLQRIDANMVTFNGSIPRTCVECDLRCYPRKCNSDACPLAISSSSSFTAAARCNDCINWSSCYGCGRWYHDDTKASCTSRDLIGCQHQDGRNDSCRGELFCRISALLKEDDHHNKADNNGNNNNRRSCTYQCIECGKINCTNRGQLTRCTTCGGTMCMDCRPRCPTRCPCSFIHLCQQHLDEFHANQHP